MIRFLYKSGTRSADKIANIAQPSTHKSTPNVLIYHNKHLLNAQLDVLWQIRQHITLGPTHISFQVLLIVVNGHVAVLHGGIVVLQLHVGRGSVQMEFGGERAVVLGQI